MSDGLLLETRGCEPWGICACHSIRGTIGGVTQLTPLVRASGVLVTQSGGAAALCHLFSFHRHRDTELIYRWRVRKSHSRRS